MKKFKRYLRSHVKLLILAVILIGGLVILLLYRLGSLTGGISSSEQQIAIAKYNWHTLYNQPFYWPLSLFRYAIFGTFHQHGQTLTRIPNVIFGSLAIISFGWLIWLWHGSRTTLLATFLFATAAWTLHVSRYANNDVLYLCSLPLLLLTQVLASKRPTQGLLYYGSMLLWGIMLYIPGLIWLVLLSIFLQRSAIKQGWQQFNSWWQRLLYVLAGLIWLPLLGINLLRGNNWLTWLGLPTHFDSVLTQLGNFVFIFIHLFVRGPENAQLWLGHAPLLDIFTLLTSLVGIYFYARHWRANRSRVLACFFLVSVFLIAAGGPVGLSLIVPLVYIWAAAGITFLLHEWLKVFPLNTLARGFGISLIVVAVLLAGAYNLRAYFVAWPNSPAAQVSFRQHR